MGKFVDYENRVFGRLTVLKRVSTNKHGAVKWLCKCACGNFKTIVGSYFVRSDHPVKSCGCLQREASTTHGAYSSGVDIRYHVKVRLLGYIKSRAQRRGYQTDLEISDMPDIPDVCPVLGIPIILKKVDGYGNGAGRGGKFVPGSPTIDRWNANLPYLKKYKNNLSVISYKANNLKSNGTLAEHEKLVEYMRLRAAQFERESLLIDSKPNLGNEAQAEMQRDRLSEETPQGDAIVSSNRMTVRD